MSIRDIHATTLAEAFGSLEDLASKEGIIFRGHPRCERSARPPEGSRRRTGS